MQSAARVARRRRAHRSRPDQAPRQARRARGRGEGIRQARSRGEGATPRDRGGDRRAVRDQWQVAKENDDGSPGRREKEIHDDGSEGLVPTRDRSARRARGAAGGANIMKYIDIPSEFWRIVPERLRAWRRA